MDFGTTLKSLAPFMVPMLALLIPIVGLLVTASARNRRTEALHQTIRHLGTLGQPVPQALIEAAAREGDDGKKPWTPQTYLRAGAINIAVGLGLMGLFTAMGQMPDVPAWLWTLGLLPLLVGVAMLVTARLELRSQT